jgi:hypothetical protein
MKRTSLLLAGALLLGCAANSLDKSKWISLFNGKDFTGWTVRGKATWSFRMAS